MCVLRFCFARHGHSDATFPVLILFCMKSIASKGRPEGFQRAIGKPFGRARRRETSDLGKAIVLSENSMTGNDADNAALHSKVSFSSLVC